MLYTHELLQRPENPKGQFSDERPGPGRGIIWRDGRETGAKELSVNGGLSGGMAAGQRGNQITALFEGKAGFAVMPYLISG
jgi:hypothetical protein